MKKILVFLIVLGFSSTAQAAPHAVFQHPIKSTEINEVQKIILQPQLLRGDFVQEKTIKGTPKKFISKGDFIFAKEQGLYWNIQTPFSSAVIFSKNGLAKIEDGKKSVVPTGSNKFFGEFSQIFQSIFAGDAAKIQNNFDIFFTKKTHGWVLGLRSNNEIMKNIFSEIVIEGDKYVQKMTLMEQYGDTTAIILKNVSSQKKLTLDEENYFKF